MSALVRAAFPLSIFGIGMLLALSADAPLILKSFVLMTSGLMLFAMLFG